MGHGGGQTTGSAAEAHNARVGLGLFGLYVALYAGFMGLSAFAPEAMGRRIAGVNVATWYGFALIGAALALAVVYMALSRDNPSGPGAER